MIEEKESAKRLNEKQYAVFVESPMANLASHDPSATISVDSELDSVPSDPEPDDPLSSPTKPDPGSPIAPGVVIGVTWVVVAFCCLHITA